MQGLGVLLVYRLAALLIKRLFSQLAHWPHAEWLLVGLAPGSFSEFIQVGRQLRIITIGVNVEVGVAGA